MKRDQFIKEEDWENYVTTLSLKVNNGFVIEEKNDESTVDDSDYYTEKFDKS